MRNRLRPWFQAETDSRDYLGVLPPLRTAVEFSFGEITSDAEFAGALGMGRPPLGSIIYEAQLKPSSLRDFENTAILYDMYFDKKQRPLSRVRFAQLMEDEHYRRIGFERLNPTCFVSTIWVGMKQFSYSAEPVIFETMAFQEFPGEFNEIGAEIGVSSIRFPKREVLAQERYCTEREALAGHAQIVREQRERLAKIS